MNNLPKITANFYIMFYAIENLFCYLLQTASSNDEASKTETATEDISATTAMSSAPKQLDSVQVESNPTLAMKMTSNIVVSTDGNCSTVAGNKFICSSLITSWGHFHKAMSTNFGCSLFQTLKSNFQIYKQIFVTQMLQLVFKVLILES